MQRRLLTVVALCSVTMALTLGALINGPEPMTAVAPVGANVTFTCVVNATELPAGTTLVSINTDGVISWIVNGTVLTANSDQSVIMNGALQTGIRQLPVIQDYITGVPVQCRIIMEGSFNVVRSSNATLLCYGPPDTPSNLTSTQSSSNALILSWSAPSSPVQLHYTVTVNTSTTTTITVTNDTNITITREQVMAAINSTECDIYTFSVTATNPAGSSIPANLTTPLTFVPADPEDAQYNVCMSSDNSTMINFQALDGYKYSIIANESECSNTTSSNTNVFQIPYPHNCTVLTVLADHNCTKGLIPVNISNVTVQCPVQPSPSTSAIITTSTSTSASIFITTAVSTSSSPTTTTTTVAPPGPIIQIIAPVAVLLLVAVTVVVTIIVLLVIVRQRKRKGSMQVKPPAPSLPPPTTATDEYSSLQHDLGGGGGPHQVVDQDQHVYDSAQGDQPQYSSIQQPKKTEYTDVQFSPDSGLEIRGNTSSTVQYSVVGDTTNMEYSVVGPKTASSQDCPPPPSADVV